MCFYILLFLRGYELSGDNRSLVMVLKRHRTNYQIKLMGEELDNNEKKLYRTAKKYFTTFKPNMWSINNFLKFISSKKYVSKFLLSTRKEIYTMCKVPNESNQSNFKVIWFDSIHSSFNSIRFELKKTGFDSIQFEFLKKILMLY